MFAKIDKEFCKCKRIIDFFKDITKFSNFFMMFFFLKIMGILMFATILEIKGFNFSLWSKSDNVVL